MTPEEVARIRTSFAQVMPIKETAAELFYGRLFEIAPDVRPMFKGDMAEQGRKLMGTLAYVVEVLDKPDELMPAASDLAKRHVGYGVAAEHYAPVGAALLWTLERGLGEAWTAETAAAWTNAYGALSGAMIDAAYGTAA